MKSTKHLQQLQSWSKENWLYQRKKVNIYGGGISLGHAIGATGARLLTSLSYQLNQKEKKYGVASLCIGGGLGLAMLLERPQQKNSRFLSNES